MTSWRWRAGRALIEAAVHAARHPIYAERNRRTKARLSRQRGPKIAQIDLARRLAEAIWHMLTHQQAFRPSHPRSPFEAAIER
jgi:transposase